MYKSQRKSQPCSQTENQNLKVRDKIDSDMTDKRENNETSGPVTARVLDAVNDETSSKTKLEKFEQKQKYIEEQNRMRKQVLASRIQERLKHTTEESNNLKNIDNQLQEVCPFFGWNIPL